MRELIAQRNAALHTAREALACDAEGRPKVRSARRVLAAIDGLVRTSERETVIEILSDNLLSGSTARYEEYVAPGMRRIEAAQFEMGTDQRDAAHFCGESPRHRVKLSPFELLEVPVTNELFGHLGNARLDVSGAERANPVVGVTWFEATLFALWLGCRLPTEAEWEFACGAGAQSQWCCRDETALTDHAWYSENADGRLHPVGTRVPNALGLFDLHGNVWEWCSDTYEHDYYSRSPLGDPLNEATIHGPEPAASRHKSCRGGSVHALAEMCRTRYRLHEPPAFWAGDLGFRLARSVEGPTR